MLYIVPTPIGNRSDITLRAIEVLKSVDMICCEDTRHSRPLLEFYEIKKPLIALHDHNEAEKSKEVLQQVLDGKTMALISDAGMPGVSDPGYRLMQECLRLKIEYTVLPGASAVITALVGSGFPSHAFSFLGFLPVKKGKRLKVLSQATEWDGTSIFFESPHRIGSTLELLKENHPQQPICIARELSKKFETYHIGTAEQAYDYYSQRKAKGEIVLLLAPKDHKLTHPSANL